MTREQEFQNILHLMESQEEENINLALQLAQNYEKEFISYFGYDYGQYGELMTFLLKHNAWSVYEPLGEVDDLYLVELGITNLPERITDLFRLKCLELTNNYLTALPTHMSSLKHLELLNISHNLFTELPLSLCNLSRLDVLFANENQIEYLPEELGNINSLRILYLDGNLLQTVPSSLCNLNKLEVLDLRYNRLKTLPKELKKLYDCEIFVEGNSNLILPPELQGWERIIF